MRAEPGENPQTSDERVSFEAEDGRLITGMLVRYNKKTVSLVTDDGHRWNVSPALLKRVATTVKPRRPNTQPQNVLAFRTGVED
jgi:hypothetical protein